MKYTCMDGPAKGSKVDSLNVGKIKWGECVAVNVYGPTPDDIHIAMYVRRPISRLYFTGYCAQKKNELVKVEIEALLDFVRDILPGEWRRKRCKQKVDMARKRCGCAVSPSPWYQVKTEDWSKL